MLEATRGQSIREEPMGESDYEKLREDAERAVQTSKAVAFLGWSTTTEQLFRDLDLNENPQAVPPVFDSGTDHVRSAHGIKIHPLEALARHAYDYLIVASNANKEDVLDAAFPFIQGTPKILVSGYDHYTFRDEAFHRILNELKVPSLANGYENTRPHLWQCIANAARLNLEGVVAEFGCYQGGTTMFLAKAIKHFGKNWPIYALDSFAGFPRRRHPYDMYDHEDLRSQHDVVANYLAHENVKLIQGDIVETACQLETKKFVLSFIDTDNYSPAMAALDVVQENTVPGGAIVFDHYTGHNRFRYTLGERIAAKRLEDDPRYFNLHDTGVFLRQR